MNISLEETIRVSPDVLFQNVGGEAVLLDLASESYFGLDAVGTRIWQLLQEHEGHLPAVHAAMLDEYEVQPDQLNGDLRALIAELARAGLVTIAVEDDAAP